MEILGIEKVSLVDYEGKICTTIFTGGCNYRCPFCHNSGIVQKSFKILDDLEIFQYLKSRKNLIDAVTISGGEPTLQPDLVEFIADVKGLGYMVKLDTNGTRPEVVEELFAKNLLDHVALDIKNNFENYGLLTGAANSQVDKVKETLKLLKNYNIPYELRTTLIENFHKEENIIKMAEDLKGETLLYLQNFVDNGTCFEKYLKPIAKEKAKMFKEILSKTIKNVVLRGYN